MAVYLVRSFRTYARIRSLTTGTFNLVVKDRIAFRLSGAPSVLDELTTRVNPAVLETLQQYRSCETLSTCTSHSISTRFPHAESTRNRRRGAEKLTTARDDIAFRFGFHKDADFAAHAEAEDRRLGKDPFGGPCFEGTLQKPTGVSESSPVAGTIENYAFS